MTSSVRSGLPPLPERMRGLPIHRGYPVPFFVAWIDGQPDFRVADAAKWCVCVDGNVCWLCGQRLGRYMAFVVGPMCIVNRTSSEPPSHRDCALFAAQACPFLARPTMERREGGLPEERLPPAGAMLTRNPGATAVWVTRAYRIFRAPNGPLIEIGDPEAVYWYAEGRAATRAEVEASIASGLPALEAMCEGRPDDLAALAAAADAARRFLPSEAA